MSRIFISYRRTDSADVTGRMYDHLAQHFSRDDLFKDVDSIGLGTDFRKAIAEAVGSCDVILAVIGRNWAGAKDKHGRERLADTDDFVRIELETGLARDIPVIPVLVSGAGMPERGALPESLQPLVFRNAIPLRPDPDFATDIQRLLKALRTILASTAPATGRPPQTRPARPRHGLSRRLAAFAVLASLLITLVYLVSRSDPTDRPAEAEDACDRPNPPATCLFK